MKFPHFIFLLVLSFAIYSCEKDDDPAKDSSPNIQIVQGCTDCNATNYDSTANVDDSSCTYLNSTYVSDYTVDDSIKGTTPNFSWSYRSYDIKLLRGNCEPTYLLIKNFASLNNSYDTFEIECEVSNDSITVFKQQLGDEGDINNYDYQVYTTKGYFTADSIYCNFKFENAYGEVFWGDFYGEKL